MLIFILIFLVALLLLYKSKFKGYVNIEVVVARYNEDLKWLNEKPFNEFPIIVYNKGNNDDFLKTKNIKKVVKLPNVGRELHTYLTHIVNNYDNLSDVTIFLPGSVDISSKLEKAKDVISKLKKSNNSEIQCTKGHDLKSLFLFEIGNYETTYHKNKNSETKVLPSKIRPFGKWYEHHFGDKPLDCVSYQGVFAVNKKDILKQPISYYQKFIQELETHSNPEVGHYIERAASKVFNIS